MHPDKNLIFFLLGLALLVFLGYAGGIYYLELRRAEIAPLPPDTSSLAEEKANYRPKIQLVFTGERFPGEGFQEARLSHLLGKVVNNGPSTISNVSVHIEYLDLQGRSISEGRVKVDKTLRPGFIAEFRYGGIEVPAEWQGQVKASVENFDFVPG